MSLFGAAWLHRVLVWVAHVDLRKCCGWSIRDISRVSARLTILVYGLLTGGNYQAY